MSNLLPNEGQHTASCGPEPGFSECGLQAISMSMYHWGFVRNTRFVFFFPTADLVNQKLRVGARNCVVISPLDHFDTYENLTCM